METKNFPPPNYSKPKKKLICENSKISKKPINSRLSNYGKFYADKSFLITVETFFLSPLINAKKLKNPILISYSSYLADIIRSIKKHVPIILIIKGSKGRLFALQNMIPYVSSNKLLAHISSFSDDLSNKKEYLNIKSEARHILKKTNPSCLISFNDSQFPERILIHEAKEMGIITINVQHGLYGKKEIITGLKDGFFADNLFVWGNTFKELYDLKRSNVYVFGYPYRVTKSVIATPINTVYLFDQGIMFNTNQKNLFKHRSKKIKEIAKICKKLNLNFICRVYRKDHKPIMEKQHPHIKFESIDSPLEKTIKKGDIFLSFDSTALLQASISGKLGVQLLDLYPVVTHNMEQLGSCDKTLTTTKELEHFLQKIIGKDPKHFKRKINEKYVKIPKNLRTDFLNLLKEVGVNL